MDRGRTLTPDNVETDPVDGQKAGDEIEGRVENVIPPSPKVASEDVHGEMDKEMAEDAQEVIDDNGSPQKKNIMKKDKVKTKEAKKPTKQNKEESEKKATAKRTREGASILKKGKYGSKAEAQEDETKQPPTSANISAFSLT